ncbi:hypothetical protein M514_18063 [Trichuris suis]|uniref:Uncharacterized protein n=1 Tax=Trichuris suis TaxID=68888 RepID=A0A085NJN2_9BILA|nr:hypothetical protein M514_18063 [Trichuris suis]
MASGQLRLDTPRKLETVRPNLGQGQATCVPPVDPSFKEMIDQLATGQQILAAETSMLASAGLRAAPYAGGLPLPPNGPYGMQSPPKVPSGQGQATCVPPVDPSFKEMIDQLATGQQILAAETSMLASAGLRAAPYAGGLPLPPNGPYGMQSPPKVPSGQRAIVGVNEMSAHNGQSYSTRHGARRRGAQENITTSLTRRQSVGRNTCGRGSAPPTSSALSELVHGSAALQARGGQFAVALIDPGEGK